MRSIFFIIINKFSVEVCVKFGERKSAHLGLLGLPNAIQCIKLHAHIQCSHWSNGPEIWLSNIEKGLHLDGGQPRDIHNCLMKGFDHCAGEML